MAASWSFGFDGVAMVSSVALMRKASSGLEACWDGPNRRSTWDDWDDFDDWRLSYVWNADWNVANHAMSGIKWIDITRLRVAWSRHMPLHIVKKYSRLIVSPFFCKLQNMFWGKSPCLVEIYPVLDAWIRSFQSDFYASDFHSWHLLRRSLNPCKPT